MHAWTLSPFGDRLLCPIVDSNPHSLIETTPSRRWSTSERSLHARHCSGPGGKRLASPRRRLLSWKAARMTPVLRAPSKCGGNCACGRTAVDGRRYRPSFPDSRDCAESSCRASMAPISAPPAASPTAPGSTLVRMWWRASTHATASMPSTTADASSQPRRVCTAVQGDEQPKPEAEIAGVDHAGEEARPALGSVTRQDARPVPASNDDGSSAGGYPDQEDSAVTAVRHRCAKARIVL